jgi:HEAT repeat protein
VLRENAVEAARGIRDPVATQIILRGLNDAQRVVRFRAALGAGEHRLAEARPPLEAMVERNDNDQHLRIACIFALHKLGVTDYSHDLEKTAVDDEPGVRGDTAFVLGLLGEKSGLKILKVLARDPDPVVRQRAWEAMWRLGDNDYVDELVGLSMSRFADDQQLAIMALAAPRNTSVREAVRTCLTADHVETSLVAARAMGMLGSDEGYGLAQKAARSNEGRQRFLAALAFGAIGRTDAQGTLRALMKDKDKRVRVAAATAVLEIAGAAGDLSAEDVLGDAVRAER